MGWLIALGILILLAILPLGARVIYNSEGVKVKIIAGPLKIQIIPAKKKDPLKPKKEKKKKTPDKKKKAAPISKPKEKPKEKGGSVTDFIPLVKIVLQLLDGLRRKIRINRLYLRYIMAGDDPCDLAVNYGKTWAAIGNLWPQLEQCFVIKKRDVEVECDFEASDAVIIAHADITITLGRLLGLLIYHGVRALIAFIKIKNLRKGGASK